MRLILLSSIYISAWNYVYVIVAESSQSRATSFASLSGIDGENKAIENYITEEAKKRNKKWKLPWGFL